MSLKTFFDIFDGHILQSTRFCGQYDFPIVEPCHAKPNNLISFDKAQIKSSQQNAWMHFYVHDRRFLPVLKDPGKYLRLAQNFKGVIGLDCSTYRNLPLADVIHAIFCNRVLDCYWQQNNIPLIPNVSWADDTSFPWCCDGIPHQSSIAVSAHGCVKDRKNRFHFLDGLYRMADILQPETVIYHGPLLEDAKRCAREYSFEILPFPSRIAMAYKKEAR